MLTKLHIDDQGPSIDATDRLDFLQSLKAEVVLGVLRKDCRGLGICKIVPTGTVAAKCSVTTVVIGKPHDRLLRCRFTWDLLCPWQQKYQFTAGRFTMEDDLILPDFVKQALELKYSSIPKGQYRTLTKGPHLDVCFLLSDPEGDDAVDIDFTTPLYQSVNPEKPNVKLSRTF